MDDIETPNEEFEYMPTTNPDTGEVQYAPVAWRVFEDLPDGTKRLVRETRFDVPSTDP